MASPFSLQPSPPERARYNPNDPAIVEKGRVMLETALDCGYRHLDTAQRYGTEPAVGAALAARFATGALGRADVWVATAPGGKVNSTRPCILSMGNQYKQIYILWCSNEFGAGGAR
jgi:aryl-alcohol dehydrogenase-like predicted oxidoreductase